jgi:DinB family protein
MKLILTSGLCLLGAIVCHSQKLWTEADRKYLAENLTRTRDSLIKETERLTEAQWNFKESADRWSINQITEHLALWELILEREISQALFAGPHAELLIRDRKSFDSSIIAFLSEEKPHITTEYTTPFTFTVPVGANEGKNNLTWLLKMRNEGISYVDTTTADLRYYFRPGKKDDVHQAFMIIFGHTDRHLRQIRKVKSNPNYPRN